MDIPDLEELEWLESHTLEDQLDDDFEIELEPPSPPSPPSSSEPPKRPILSLPPKPSPLKTHPQIYTTAKKRAGAELSKSISLDVNDNYDLEENGSYSKRSRIGEKEARNENTKCSDVGPVETDERSGATVGSEVLLDGNVGSVKNNDGSNDDEEWLRYSPPQRNVEEIKVVERETKERILSRYATEIGGDCVPVTGLDGERVYAKICRVEIGEEEKKKKPNFRGELNGLLQESVRVLMQKVEHEEFAKALKESVESGPSEVVPSKEPITNEQLWVDKYAPSSFTELLSDEQTNREVLLWLKQWDSCVFGSDIKSTTDDVLSALRRHSSGSQHLKQSTMTYSGKNRETRFSRDILKAQNELDKENNISEGIQEIWDKRHKSSGPPEQKILLLCGSPGLGKTTLAHVAARHCGYRVVEINASDDRSASTIEAKILDVVQMNSVIADSKPKCLVIDEVDGALGDGKGAVEVILKLLSAERKVDTGKGNIVAQEANSGRKSSRKKQKSSLLLRPVICICNDLYAPALRPLRQVAKVHIFVQPTVSRVVKRLKYICNKEGVKTSSIALSALAECTECDIRSCLNTLQFLNRKKEILNVLEISSQVVGRKDATKSAFDIWKEIFQMRKGKYARKSNNSGTNTSEDFDFLYSMISNRGDYDLILDGIHENILQLRYIDPLMQKTVQCLDNLGGSDITYRYIMRTQQMSLLVYQPGIAILIHSLIAQLEKKDIEWPKSFQRHRTLLAERMDTFHTWHSRISPCISRHLSTKSFVEDSISPLLHILSPPTVKPVTLHLLSDKEKSDVGQLVNTMVSYSITYKNIKSDRSGTARHEDALDATTISLDPPLRDFILFKGYDSCHIDLALAVKQVLIHEVERQKILQGSLSKSTNLHMNENHALAKNNAGSGVPSKSRFTNGSAEEKMNRRSLTAEKFGLSTSSNSTVAESGGSKAIDEVKSVERKKRPSGTLTSFFNRKGSSEGSQITNNVVQKPAMVRRDSHPLLFKFNEGFTNAVKRPVRVREFLA